MLARLFILALLGACTPQPVVPLSLQPIGYDSLPGWEAQDHAAALEAFRQSCRKFASHPATTPSKVADMLSAPDAWRRACHKADATTENHAEAFFAESFQPYRATAPGKGDTGLLTGYYEPLLQGSLIRTERFRHPVWGVPHDWHPTRAYRSRRDIDTYGLAGKAEPLLYVDDPVNLFFLHIQGSGRVALPDGQVAKLSFAGKNNRPYFAIGKYLLERGEVPRSEISATKLKDWLRAHPARAREVMWMNESYIFFERGEESTGAIGAQGVPLTPEASIAIDPAMLPYGVPVYLDTSLPYSTHKYRHLVVTQDTGSAIRGALRADLFFGPGHRAEHLASGMKQAAKFFVLLPRFARGE